MSQKEPAPYTKRRRQNQRPGGRREDASAQLAALVMPGQEGAGAEGRAGSVHPPASRCGDGRLTSVLTAPQIKACGTCSSQGHSRGAPRPTPSAWTSSGEGDHGVPGGVRQNQVGERGAQQPLRRCVR